MKTKTTSNSTTLRRREFVRLFMVAGVASALRPGIAFAQAPGKLAPNDFTTGYVRLKLTDYPELGVDNGSIYFEVPGAVGVVDPMIVTRLSGNRFFSVSSVCTHSGCTVNPFSASVGSIFCPCHGSRFTADGRVLAGPARSSLPSFRTTFDSQTTITIEIPRLGFRVTGALVPVPPGPPRYRLDFPTIAGLSYEVRFATGLAPTGEWRRVNFALSADAPADQAVYSSFSGTPVSLFVELEGEAGFFAVALSTG